MIAEQGFEMGRPSFIRMRVERSAGRDFSVAIGGNCVMLGCR